MTKLPKVRELPNHFKYIIAPRHRAKIASIQIWVRVGSVHETAAEYGIAHFIEHMLFKGTSEHDVGEVSSLIEHMGGDINAYTTFDHTVIHATVLSEYAMDALKLLKQALMESSFDAAELENERQVIIEEIKRSEDDPGSILGHTVLDQVYGHTPYGRPIFGTLESVETLTRQQICDFHSKWYQPQNMFVVVCGDVDETECEKTIHTLFSPLKKISQLDSHVDEGSFLPGRQIKILKSENQLPRIEISLPAPSIDHADAAALNLICFMIGHMESGPLAADMRDKQGIVAAATCNFHLSSYRGIISFSFVPEIEAIESVIAQTMQIINDIGSGKFITELGMQVARSNFLVDRIHDEETVDGLARTYGACLLSGYGLEFEDLFQSRTTSCSIQELRTVAAKWFQTETLALVVQVSEDLDIGENLLKRALEIAAIKMTSSEDVKASGRETIELQLPHFEKTSEAVSLIHNAISETQLISIVAAAPGGLRVEKLGAIGWQHAIGSLIANATSKLNSEQYSTVIEGLGASISGFSGKDSVGIRAQFLLKDFAQMSDILVESLLDAKIESEKLETFRRQILQTIAAEGDSPAGLCMRRFQERIFESHPYRYPLYGSKNFIESLTTQDLEQYGQSYFPKQKWILSVAGGISLALAQAFAKKFDAALKKAPISKASASKALKEPEIALPKDHKKEQVHVVMGGVGAVWTDPLRPAIDVVTSILGGAGGRLFIELRDRAGLVYTVSPFANHGAEGGLIGVYFACQPKNLNLCKELVAKQVAALQAFDDADEELNRAKQFILGGHETEMQRTESIAMNTALMALYGLGHDEMDRYRSAIAEVGVDDIKKVARQFFDTTKWISSEAGVPAS